MEGNTLVNIILAMMVGGILSLFVGRRWGKQIERVQQKISKQTATDFLDNARNVAESEKKVMLLETNEKIRILEAQKQEEFTQLSKQLTQQKNANLLESKELDFLKQALVKQEAVHKVEYETFLEAKKTYDEYVQTTNSDISQRLSELAELSKDEAQKLVLAESYAEVSKDIAQFIKTEETKATYKIKQKSKNALVQAMQKYTAEVATERTVSVVSLASEDLKGRLIGREGRNIRSIEALTGVDVIIDDTPETVVLSCFDPIRRELARMVVQELVDDGRIHPGRIEEVFKHKQEDLHQLLIDIGEQAIDEMNLPTMPEEMLELLGKLHFRTSYGQNILQHSKEVGYISGLLAVELGEDPILARRAGLLHDIGKAVDFETEGTHIELGIKIAKKFQESAIVIDAISSHHGDVAAQSIIAELVAIADGLSATRPGARRESIELYIKRLSELEEISTSFTGVEKAYAIQAGREIRILVNPQKVDDSSATLLAHDVRKRIEDTMQYPGTIKVTVIRETRAIDIAK